MDSLRDTDGFPRGVRRRLAPLAGTQLLVDLDDGQRFKVRKLAGGRQRALPVFDGWVKWAGAEGYAATRLLLSCLGAEGEYVLWDAEAGAEMTLDEWRKRKFTSASRPPIRHEVCGNVATTKQITNLHHGGGIRCPGCVGKLNQWSERYPELVDDLPLDEKLIRQRKRKREYRQSRYQTDVQFCTTAKLRSVLGKALQGHNTAYRQQLIGCTASQLITHLSSKLPEGKQMSDMEVDHIEPCFAFDLTDPVQQRKCFNWSNLQLLTREENQRKGVVDRALMNPDWLPCWAKLLTPHIPKETTDTFVMNTIMRKFIIVDKMEMPYVDELERKVSAFTLWWNRKQDDKHRVSERVHALVPPGSSK